MGSSSGRRSGSSGRSTNRKKVVIAAQDTVRVRQGKPKQEPKTKRRTKRSSSSELGKRSTGQRPVGHRLAASKRQEREDKLARQRLNVRLRVVLLVVLVGALVYGMVAVYRSQVFAIENVAVTGAEHLGAERVRALAAIPADATLPRTSVEAIEGRLAKDPWIASAQVERDFPDTLRISVKERRPAALVDAGGTQLWLVDKTGVWLGPRTSESTGALLVIRDVESLDATPGARTANKTLRNALDVVTGISPELRAMIRVVTAPSVDKTALITNQDVEIFIGSADDVKKKDRIARTILEEQQGNVVYINVRTVDRPTWRGIDTAQ